MDKFSYLNTIDPKIIEAQYSRFLENPGSVSNDWKQFFEGFEFALKNYGKKEKGVGEDGSNYPAEFKVINLINGYRLRGHLFTKTNPVRTRRQYTPTLAIENFGLAERDLDHAFAAGSEIGIGTATLRQIIDHLEQTYCQSVGLEFSYIRTPEIRLWLQSRLEKSRSTFPYSKKDRQDIYQNLAMAVLFEKFVHKKFPGQKSFSLEGAESLIPALEAVIERGALLGIEEFVIGMAHRGRLNVLTNILKKPYSEVFSEFKGLAFEEEYLLGDVKYHLGYVNERLTLTGKKVRLTLSPNPSHLEAVNPVVEGMTRAMIDKDYKGNLSKVAPILIHGDASIAGQGIVYEVLQMSELQGYRTGGTIHIVVNNQLGFTTNYLEGRSSTYCTDVAKTLLCPVFHVNGDDVEAVIYCILLAMEFRQKFHKDVFIDLLCYRKYGHNEGDEPRYTQPILYKIIEKHPNPIEIYRQQCLDKGYLDEEFTRNTENQINQLLDINFEESKKIDKAHIPAFLDHTWNNFRKAKPADFEKSPGTGVKKSKLIEIGKAISQIPPDENFFRKLVQLQESRRKMIEELGTVDWAMGELLAYGSLLEEGIPVRLSGQDTVRGTFSHRHAVLKIEDSEKEYFPLNHISKDQAKFEIYNSLLSEFGVLGFEYGYALAFPKALTIWEAQYGDFANGAQIIFDQFISSAEDKWNMMNGLVLYLPHGFEGQGPDHSSARVERYLSLAAEFNIQVANVTVPANLFHLLRRQAKTEYRKPLVLFTPKSLLRHPKCISSLDELSTGKFIEVMDDPIAQPEKITKVVFCTGKIYYEILEEKEKIKADDTAIIRLEQIHPLPIEQLKNIVSKYKLAKEWLWTQEEPVNMGVWPFLQMYFEEVPLRLIARPATGSTATGSPEFHKIQQRKIIDKTFTSCDCPKVTEECRMVCIGNRWRSFEKELAKHKGRKISSKSISAVKRLK